MTAQAIEQRTIEYTQERLTEWGQWLRNLRGIKLGYSSHAAFVIERVDNDHVGDVLMDDTSNDRAEEIEAIMCRLADLAPSLHRALVECYLSQRPQAIAAQHCHCSVSVYRARLRTGEMCVATRILA